MRGSPCCRATRALKPVYSVSFLNSLREMHNLQIRGAIRPRVSQGKPACGAGCWLAEELRLVQVWAFSGPAHRYAPH
jgi:hypothetical protein